MMAQSGLRPHTLCKLRLKHVEPELSRKTIPCKIDVPQEIAKGKYGSYFTFMGDDSAKNLQDYLRLIRKKAKPDDYLFTKHGSNKPMTPNAMSVCFKALVNKLRITGNINFERTAGKPAELRLYNLRKYFRKFAGIMADDKHVQFWMGHTLGVDDHYFSRDVELHRKVYTEKAMPYLRLEKTILKPEQDKEIQQLQAQVKKLQDKYKQFERLFGLYIQNAEQKMTILDTPSIWDEQAEHDRAQYELDEQESKQLEKEIWKLVREMSARAR